MKNIKRIIGFLALALFVAAVAITAIAQTEPEYTGKVTTMKRKLEIIGEKEDFFEKDSAISDAQIYLEKVDPALPEYQGFVAKLDSYELLFAGDYVDIVLTEATAAAKHETLDSITDWLAEHPFADSTTALVSDNGTPDDASDDTVYTVADFLAELLAAETKIAESYLTEAKTVTTADSKHLLLDSLGEFVAAYAPATSEVYNTAAVESENFECAKLYLAAVNVSAGDVKSGIALRRVLGFMADHPFPKTLPDYSEFEGSLTLKASSVDSALLKAKNDAELRARVGDYDRKPIVRLDFNGSAEGGVSVYNTGYLTPENYLEGNVVYSYIGEDSGKDGKNGYYTISFGKASKYSSTTAAIPTTITDSVVFECDLTTFDRLPNTNVLFESGAKTVNGKALTRTYIQITQDGDIQDGNKVTLLEDAVIPGQWIHISFVINQTTNVVDIYIDYRLVKSVDLSHSEGYVAAFERVKIGANPTVAGGSVAIDNVRLYQGFAPRANDSYLSMTEEEKFVFCTQQMSNTTALAKDMMGRIGYYEEAKRRLSLFWDGINYSTHNASVRSAVDALLAFEENSYSLLCESLSDANLEKYLGIVTKLEEIDIGESTYSTRVYFADLADTFSSRNSLYITAGDAYNEARDTVMDVRMQLRKEDSLLNFINAVNEFYTASTIADMQNYYRLAGDVLKSTDVAMATSGAFPSFDEAYARYQNMEAILADEITIENSKFLLATISYVIVFDTEEKWNENYLLLKPHVIGARKVIAEGNYDPYYKNLGELVTAFAPMSDYFYVKIQTDHFNYITAELNRYDESEKYFEKYGILVKLKEYLLDDTVDKEIDAMKALIDKIDTGLSKLESDKEAYNALLASNTEKFIEKCQGLLGSVSFVNMKAICDEVSVYYYAMDVTSAAAQDAIAVYAARCEEIEAIEANAKNFVVNVALFDVSKKDVLENIISASEYLPTLEISCDGVEAALARFNTEITIFNAEVERTNAEILATVETVAYISNNKECSPLITVMLNTVHKK